MKVSFPYICSRRSDIPEEAFKHLETEIVDRLGESFSCIFPRFSSVFVESTKVIEGRWEKPILVLEKGVKSWLKYILVQTESQNLFFNLQPVFMEKDGDIFEEDHEMLPDGWKEVYRWFNSFCITDLDYSPSDWWNTPFRFESRLDLDDYEKGSGVSRDKVDKFLSEIGCERYSLRCWLLTESGDALFINEAKCDQKVYHVNGKALDDFSILENPVNKLDEYLSHLLKGLVPGEFNWRKNQ